tara:strand:- start:32616 stop:33650 length:1035 start_codon:yes stop_codon:yes gene_type:complete
MNLKKKLKILENEMNLQSDFYKPTPFWREINREFFRIFSKSNFKNFRSEKLSNNFFVPLYNNLREPNINKINILIKKKNFSNKISNYLRDFINGDQQALSDYRVFKATDDVTVKPYINFFSESNNFKPLEQFNFDKKVFSKSSLNYLLALSIFKKVSKKFNPKIILEIGGGFGTLGEIFFKSGKNYKYINLDLPPLNLLAENYLKKCFGQKNVTDSFLIRNQKTIEIKRLKKISSLCNWQIKNLKGKIDLFVNLISFQEMEPYIVKNYLNKVIRLNPKFILMRNLREGKQLKKKGKIGVKRATKKKDYIKFLKKNYKLIFSSVKVYGFETFDKYNSELLIFKKK